MDTVDRTLQILKRGLKRKISSVENSVLTELHAELSLYYENLTADGNCSKDYLMDSIVHLGTVIQRNPSHNNTTSKKTQVQHPNQEHVPKLGVVTADIKDGKVIYLVDGQPIKFKKMKDTTVYHHRWQLNYAALREFYQHHGHVIVTRSTENYEDLGNWVTEQRRKLRRGKVSQRQFELLNELGFEWDRSHYFFRTYHKKKSEEEGKQTQIDQSQEDVR